MIYGLLALTGFFAFCGCWIWATLSEPEAFRCGSKFPDQEGDET